MKNQEEYLRRVVTLSPERFDAFIRGLYGKCDQWLTGQLPGDRLAAVFARVQAGKTWQLDGLYGRPDDFDWSSLPELVAIGETLQSRFLQASRMMHAATHTIGVMGNRADTSPIRRAYFFGTYLREAGWIPEEPA